MMAMLANTVGPTTRPIDAEASAAFLGEVKKDLQRIGG
jgi:hypothetical protein